MVGKWQCKDIPTVLVLRSIYRHSEKNPSYWAYTWDIFHDFAIINKPLKNIY